MAGWGMGHNLEKNLQKVQSFREKGQLERALKQLQDWARKHDDTPHYLYEAAMVAFDLDDWTTGINSLRSLLRSFPDTRDKVLGACRERFSTTPALPLAEFLVDQDLADGEIADALDLIETLDDNELSIYRRKATMRHQSLVATQATPEAAALNSHCLQLLLACAAGDGSTALEATDALLAGDPDEWRPRIEPLLGRAVDRHGDDGHWMLARAFARQAGGAFGEASTLAASAARRDKNLVDRALARIESVEPEGDDRGPWWCARGDLALQQGRGDDAAHAYTEAADAAPGLRDDLVERIARATTGGVLDEHGELLKLHLRLLVVQKRFGDIPPLAQRLLKEGLAEAQEMRSLLGEGRSEGLPSEMLVVMAETALRDGDLSAAATHAHEIPSDDDTALQRLLGSVEERIEDWPAETRLQLDALRAVLLSRTRSRERANECLARMWEEHADQTDTLFAVTEKCLGSVEPLPRLVRSALGPALDAGRAEQIRPIVEGMLSRDDGPNGGAGSGFFDQEALSLDFGQSDEDFGDQLGEAFVGILEDDPSRGDAMIAFLDAFDPAFGLKHRFRHAVALAALHAGDLPRALPEITVLVMMGDADLLQRVGEQLDVALQRRPDEVELLMTRADLHADAGEIESAATTFSRALAADPARAEELTRRFEQLLGRVDESEAAPLWRGFGEALFQAGRFDQLVEVCRRALDTLPNDQVAPFLVLQARMLIEEGRLSDALQTIQQHLVSGRLPAPLAVELLEDILEAHPASSIAQLMLGQAATRADRIDTALEAYFGAVRLDRSLAAPVSEQIHKVLARPGTTAAHVLRVAAHHREQGDPARAADAFERALRMDPRVADRVLGELADVLDEAEAALEFVKVGAFAARHAADVDRACELLLRLDQRDPASFELVLAELRQLRESHDARLLPALCIARVLLHHDAPEAAAQTVVEASRHEGYDLDERVEMLHEFHRRMTDDADLTLALAARLGEQGAHEGAVDLVRTAMELRGFDADAAVEVGRELLEREPEQPQLRLLRHDLLVRVGRVDDALRALPDPASLGPWQQTEISERLAEYPARVQASPELSLLHARSLHGQGRTEDAIEALRRATERTEAGTHHALWTELARLLHEAGRDAESRDILLGREVDPATRREAYQLYADWNEQRLESELRALEERHRARPQATHIALQYAEKLLEAGRPGRVADVLREDAQNPEWKVRRALLLARAHLDLDHADRAEAILLDARRHVAEGDEAGHELLYRLAECADRLGRPAAATAHLNAILDAPAFQERAAGRARNTYQRYLDEVSGNHRAVLTRVSTL